MEATQKKQREAAVAAEEISPIIVTDGTAAVERPAESINIHTHSDVPKKRYLYRFVKRSFDILVSLTGLIVLSPVFLIISAVVFFSEGGRPVFHRRHCVGKNGYYNMLKFRTMVKDADDLEKYLHGEQLEAYIRDCKLEEDPRITKTGKFLRKTSLDELPQLFNVLKGEMSIVGPRPVIEREAEAYGRDKEKLLSCRPGITGYWQVYGRGTNSYIDDESIRMQLYYTSHQSIGLDIKLILKTVSTVLTGKGAK